MSWTCSNYSINQIAKKCNSPTCLAFAADVFKRQKQLGDRPNLGREIIAQYGRQATQLPLEQEMDQAVEQLKKMITMIDLPSSSKSLGGTYSEGKLTIATGNRKKGLNPAYIFFSIPRPKNISTLNPSIL